MTQTRSETKTEAELTIGAQQGPAPDGRSAVLEKKGPVPFSLFDGDWLHRFYSVFGLSDRAHFPILKRCLVAVALTWIPVAALALFSGFSGTAMSATNFFADFAAYAQFWLAMPLFILAEPIADASTRLVAIQLVSCHIVRSADHEHLSEVHAVIRRLGTSIWPDLVCIIIAYALSLVILIPEFGPDHLSTWHVQDHGSGRSLTLPGAWEFLIALPLLNYIWLRFFWKIVLWLYYLARIARLRLELHPAHPDLTGGIGFISEAQSRFAVAILAYGISNVAATVGYEVVILHYKLATITVWGPMLGFAIGAPLLFTLPLFMFTQQLYRAKMHALATYRERITARSRWVEKRWLAGQDASHYAADEMREFAELSTLTTLFLNIQKMRIVPFDLRSLFELMASSFGSIATLIPLLNFNGQIAILFDAIGKLLAAS